MAPVRRLVRRLSARPTLWNLFRRALEFNFIEENRVIGQHAAKWASTYSDWHARGGQLLARSSIAE